jgi:hypothetical protein
MFPLEIIDLIILFTDFETSINLCNEYTSKKLYNPQNHTWNLAAMNAHLEVAQFLFAMDLAAEYGNLETVKWLNIRRMYNPGNGLGKSQ